MRLGVLLPNETAGAALERAARVGALWRADSVTGAEHVAIHPGPLATAAERLSALSEGAKPAS